MIRRNKYPIVILIVAACLVWAGWSTRKAPINAVNTILADRRTDMPGEILRRTRRYDLLPAELHRLQVFIIAPHALGFWGAVDRILANDLDLGNIRILYDPGATGVNVTLDVQQASVQLDWYGDSYNYSEWVQEAQSLSTIMKKILRYES